MTLKLRCFCGLATVFGLSISGCGKPAEDSISDSGMIDSPHRDATVELDATGDGRDAQQPLLDASTDAHVAVDSSSGDDSGAVDAGPGADSGGFVCGDHRCDSGETSANCCTDCGCSDGSSCIDEVCRSAPACGDGTCNEGESTTSCCLDCGCPSRQSCTDGVCRADDICGDGMCTGTETSGSCCQDCGCTTGRVCDEARCVSCGDVGEPCCGVDDCDTGYCASSGVCTAQCRDGEVRCISGELTTVEVCVDRAWTPSTCEEYSVCARNECTPVCDGELESFYPRVCAFPLNDHGLNGTFFYTNDTRRLPVSALRAGAGTSSSTARISTSGATWPYEWNISSSNAAYIYFGLSGFVAPASQVTLSYKARRAGVIPNATYARVQFNNPSRQVAWGQNILSRSWDTNGVFVVSPYPGQLDYSGGLNFITLTMGGDGFGNPPDLGEVNWILLDVRQ